MEYAVIEKMAQEAGFTHVAPLDPKTLQLKPEVRQMCEVNSCGMYGKRWSCPPGCGSLEECAQRVSRYSRGILVQTVGELEDELDGEGMMDAEHQHKENFLKMNKLLRQDHADVLALGAGCCTVSFLFQSLCSCMAFFAGFCFGIAAGFCPVLRLV